MRATLPELQRSAATLRDLPGQLAEAKAGLADSRDSLDTIGLLGRIAVVLVGLVLVGVVLVTAESAVLRAGAREPGVPIR